MFLLVLAVVVVAASPLRVTRDGAVHLGAEQGPGVAVANAPLRGVAEMRDAANTFITQSPRVQFMGGGRTYGPQVGMEAGLMVTQDIPLGDVRAERRENARLMGRTVEADRGRARLDAAARGGLAWTQLAEAQRLLALRTESHAQALAIAEQARTRVKAGVGMPSELAQAEGEVGAAEGLLLEAEGLVFDATCELRFSLGLPLDTTLAADGDLLNPPALNVDAKALWDRVRSRHPAVLAAQERATLAHQEARLTAATGAPMVSVGASMVREGAGDHVATVLFSVPIPFNKPAAFDVARQHTTARTADANVGYMQATVLRDLQQALHECEHWRETLHALVTHARPPLEESLRLARVQYSVGSSDATAVHLARQRLLLVEEQITRAAAEVQRADVRLGHAAATLLEETP
jgi:outer membrane protein TolC